jgi:hypothetical protein
MRKLCTILTLALGLAMPLEAGIEYKARTWQEGQQAANQAEMTVWARIDGDNARVEFQESGNPWMTEGSYLLTTDAGKTLYLVKPEEKTYGEFDLDQVMQMLGALSESGVIDFQIENPRLETLESGPGKTVAGLATEHARYRTTYDMRMKILGFKKMQRIETVQDVWYTTAVRDAAMGVWLRKEPPRTGTDLDQLIDLEVSKIKGFPLETAETMITTGKKGRQTTTTTRMRVSEMNRGASFAAGIFVIPSDYTAVQIMPTEAMMAGGQQQPGDEEGEKKGGVLGRFKKFGKKKDG